MTSPVSYKIPGASVASGVSADHLKKEIRAGRLAAKKVGRDYLITHEALVTWIAALPDAD
jgi:excisionase family DNA binding protein